MGLSFCVCVCGRRVGLSFCVCGRRVGLQVQPSATMQVIKNIRYRCTVHVTFLLSVFGFLFFIFPVFLYVRC